MRKPSAARTKSSKPSRNGLALSDVLGEKPISPRDRYAHEHHRLTKAAAKRTAVADSVMAFGLVSAAIV